MKIVLMALTNTKGEPFYLNVEEIESITVTSFPSRLEITMISGRKHVCTETIEQIQKYLEQER